MQVGTYLRLPSTMEGAPTRWWNSLGPAATLILRELNAPVAGQEGKIVKRWKIVETCCWKASTRNSGYIDRWEFKKILVESGLSLSTTIALLRALDLNANRRLSYQKLLAFIHTFPQLSAQKNTAMSTRIANETDLKSRKPPMIATVAPVPAAPGLPGVGADGYLALDPYALAVSVAADRAAATARTNAENADAATGHNVSYMMRGAAENVCLHLQRTYAGTGLPRYAKII